jgi:hypothetical protein
MIRPVFDDRNLVSSAGLVPVLRLGEAAGLYELLAGLTVPAPNARVKTAAVIGGMLAGADSIDDMNVLRHGGMGRLFTGPGGGVRAPSTLGTFLRSFTHGHVQQLDKASSGLLRGLAERVPGLLAGADERSGEGGLAFIDVDDTVREVHGYAKQGAGFGYSKVRGLNVQLAAVGTPLAAPVIAAARLRKGNSASAAGCGRLLAQAIGTARAAGVVGQIMCRADSAYYGWAFVGTTIRHKVLFSVTARMDKKVTAAVAAIGDDAWTTIKYPEAIWENDPEAPGGGYWISDAQVAETGYVAFTGRRKAEHVSCRLVVRRVKRLQPAAPAAAATQKPGEHTGEQTGEQTGGQGVQGELFDVYRHHAFITNSTLNVVEADERHRDHAIIEQVIAELKNGPLAHLPSGKYAANAAWVACAVIAFNLARAAATAAGMRTARWATLQKRIITVPARIATTSRRLDLHLPTHWPWAQHWTLLWDTATGSATRTGRPTGTGPPIAAAS